MTAGDSSDLERAIGVHLDAGDHAAAAAAILRGYGPEILSYLVGVCRDPQLADDVFSTLGEDLWRGLPGFRRESSVRTWLYRLTWHALQRHRKDPYQRRRVGASRQLTQLVDEIRSRTAPFLRTENKTALARLRQQLTTEEQTLLVLRVDRGLSWREVAHVMTNADGEALSEAALTKRFQRVKDKLRELAAESGLLDEL